MKIGLYVGLVMKDSIWNLVFVEKKLELEAVPRVGDEIEDSGIPFEVESVKFNIDKDEVEVTLKDFDVQNEIGKKDVLKRMEDSGWFYRDPEIYTLTNM